MLAGQGQHNLPVIVHVGLSTLLGGVSSLQVIDEERESQGGQRLSEGYFEVRNVIEVWDSEWGYNQKV